MDNQHITQRLDRAEHEIDRLRVRVDALATKSAVTDTLISHINDILKEIKEDVHGARRLVTRVGYTVVSTVIVAMLTWALKGGMAGVF